MNKYILTLTLLLSIITPLFSQTRPHWLDIKYAPHTIRSVKEYGAVGNGTTDDTAAIQAAIDSGNSLHFPNGSYLVSNINFNQVSKAYYFNDATIVGSSTSAATSVVQITGHYLDFYDLKINGNKRSGDIAGIHWHSLSSGAPAQWVRIHNLNIVYCNIGILFGQLDGVTEVDAPQSENVVNNYLTRGVRIPIYMNQSNGFLHMNTPILDCQVFEYTIAEGAYPATASYAIKNIQGILHVNGGEVLKTTEQVGHCIWNQGNTYLHNVTIESATTIASSSGILTIQGSSGGFFSNAGLPLFENFGVARLSGLSFFRPDVAIDTSGIPAIIDRASSTTIIRDSYISGWRAGKSVGRASNNYAMAGDLLLDKVWFPSDSNFSLSNSGANLFVADVEYVATATPFTIYLGSGASATHTIVSVTDNPFGYGSASQLLGETGQTVSLSTPLVPIHPTRGGVLEYWLKHVSGPFNSVSSIRYVSADGTTPIGAPLLIATVGKGEGSIAQGETTGGAWQKLTFVVPPRSGAAYVYFCMAQEQECTVQRTGFTFRQ